MISLFVPVHAGAQEDVLRNGFLTPPQSAKPRVWWHWMNGNISKEGIRKDLLWMDRVGLGGIQIFATSYHLHDT